jgi:hypothetical protein
MQRDVGITEMHAIPIARGLSNTPARRAVQMEQPPVNGTELNLYFCKEMLDRPVHFQLYSDMAKACLPSETFDPYDPVQVATLPATATCKDGCKAKLEALISKRFPGWGCCVKSLLNGFALDPELKRFSGG